MGHLIIYNINVTVSKIYSLIIGYWIDKIMRLKLNCITYALQKNRGISLSYSVRSQIWFILFSNTSTQVKALWAWNLHRPTLSYDWFFYQINGDGEIRTRDHLVSKALIPCQRTILTVAMSRSHKLITLASNTTYKIV